MDVNIWHNSFKQYDADNNGIIDFTEFLAFCMDLNSSDSEKAVTDLFLAAGAQGKKYVSLRNEKKKITLSNNYIIILWQKNGLFMPLNL